MKYIFTLWKGWSRFIRSHKLQSATCIIGLSLGMACYALSMLWMHHLESFEDFVPDGDRIFLMGNKQSDYNGTAHYNSEGYFAQYLIENYPEVVASARFCHRSFKKAIGASEPYNTQVEEATCWQVEPEFLDLFGFKAIEGSTNFLDAHDVVITLEMSKRFFGKDSAIGKKLSFRNIGESKGLTMTVIGVIENWPENSQFRGDIFTRCDRTININNGGFGQDFRWGAIFKVREGIDPNALEKKIHDNVSNLSYRIAQFAPHMLPLRKLRSHYPSESTDVNLKFVRMFMILGLLVIIASLCNFVIALINNMRLRSRNMMLHRLMGASTLRIIVLNALDTLLLFALSAIIGLIIISLFLPTFREYSQIYMPASTILADICIYLSIVTLAGIAISAITTYIVVRGDNRTLLRGHQSHRSSSGLDRISMVVQFAMGIGMIICTLVMMLQINYLTRTNALGFSRENIIAIGHCTPEIEQKILTSPDIESHISRCPTVFPLMMILEESLFSNKADVGIDSLSLSFYRFIYTPEMLKFWNMELKEGVLPKPETDEVLVNEAASRALGFDNPIGKEIYVVHPYIMNNTEISTYKITGLVADIYTAPPTQEPNRAIYLIADRMEEQRSIYFYETYMNGFRQRE